MVLSDLRVPPDRLRWRLDTESLGFSTTAELTGHPGYVGQDRALEALDFGVHIPASGYNIFVMGPAGAGRASMTQRVLSEAARAMPTPADVCYVYNFSDPRRPRALMLPPGMGRAFKTDMDELIEDLEQEVTAAFETEEYTRQRDEVLREFREERQAEFEALEKEANAEGLAIARGPAGIVVVPAIDREMMTPQQYAELPEEQRKEVDRKREQFQEKLLELLRRGQREEKAAREQVKRLDRETIRFATEHLLEELCEKYRRDPKVCEHLEQVKQDIIDNVATLRDSDEQHGPPLPAFLNPARAPFKRYEVNLLLGQPDVEGGAPVIYEPNPTIENLTGQIEHQSQMGALTTDFSMIRAGALHRANGGFLIVDAEAVLRRPYAWEALKRCLRSGQIKIESLQDQLRFISTVSLEPEPIPLSVKVVLIGTPMIYYLLHAYDEDFRKHFKVQADLATYVDRSAEVISRYAGLVAERCREEGLLPFTAAAVARVIEHAARLAGDQAKLSTRFVDVCDLIREASYWAGRRRPGAEVADAEDVQYAIDQQVRRANRIEELILQMIAEGRLLIDTQGAVAGQVNGLSLIPIGEYVIGKPSRITCRTFAGRSGVVQIDREAKMTGPIHDKGVMILTGFLGDRFARRRPLSMAASIVFEQSYEGVEGDSASAAELFALLSSLADLPISQSVAVTGSVNQFGVIQPIGGVTRKVEGFFDTCRVLGLSGKQGVVIPRSNVGNLMLRQDVVEAVEEGKFHIWAISTVDEGIELLTGVAAGEPDEEGVYPPESVNGRAQARLAELCEIAREFGAGGAGEGRAGEDDRCSVGCD